MSHRIDHPLLTNQRRILLQPPGPSLLQPHPIAVRLPPLRHEEPIERIALLTSVRQQTRSQQRHGVRLELRPNPLLAALGVLARRLHMPQNVIDEAQIFGGELELAANVGVGRIGGLDRGRLDVDEHIGQVFLLLEQNVGRADRVAVHRCVGQQIHVGQRQIGQAKVAGSEQRDRGGPGVRLDVAE